MKCPICEFLGGAVVLLSFFAMCIAAVHIIGAAIGG